MDEASQGPQYSIQIVDFLQMMLMSAVHGFQQYQDELDKFESFWEEHFGYNTTECTTSLFLPLFASVSTYVSVSSYVSVSVDVDVDLLCLCLRLRLRLCLVSVFRSMHTTSSG